LRAGLGQHAEELALRPHVDRFCHELSFGVEDERLWNAGDVERVRNLVA
jgi:hypothetical protein